MDINKTGEIQTMQYLNLQYVEILSEKILLLRKTGCSVANSLQLF